MLPKPEDGPTSPPVECGDTLVSAFVRFDLILPKLSSDCGQTEVPATSVPEARVHENHGVMFPEDDIRGAKVFLGICAVTKSFFPERFSE